MEIEGAFTVHSNRWRANIDVAQAFNLDFGENKDMFAWTSSDMLGIYSGVMTLKLAIYKDSRPITQNKRRNGEERRAPIKTKVTKFFKPDLSEKSSTPHSWPTSS